jgi:hypothetical protein
MKANGSIMKIVIMAKIIIWRNENKREAESRNGIINSNGVMAIINAQ